jgi:hypothetical protein
MKLEEAFKAAITKFYEGYDFAESTKINPKMGEYSFQALDSLHKEIVPKRKPQPIEEEPEEELIPDDD